MDTLDAYLKSLESLNIIAWIMGNNLKTERGLPVEFDTFAFMIDPYMDWTPLQGTRKCSQIGWSTMTNIKLFYAAKFGVPGIGLQAANVIYTLPTDRDVQDFVPTKTNMIVANNPILRAYIQDSELPGKKDLDTVKTKQIGNSSVYFKGTKSKSAALMISSDINIHDEADRSEASVVEQYESRLDKSLYKARWIFSNPSAPNQPADSLFKMSDQKFWFIKCEHCGHYQYLDWYLLSEHEPKHKALHCYVDDKAQQFVCSGCGKIISDKNRQRGVWVKKYNTREISGYWVSHFMCSWKTCASLVQTYRNKSKAYWLNFVCGLPYVGSDVSVDGNVIVNNIVLNEIKWTPGHVAMGIDNGDVKHYVIGDESGLWELGKTKSWDDIERLIQKYQPYYIIDMNPYPNRPREIVKKYRHGWLNFYKNNPNQMDLVEWGEGDNMHMVYPQRDRVIDDLVSYIFDGNVKFIGAKSKWEEYISHWESMYQATTQGDKMIQADQEVTGTDAFRLVQKRWTTSTGNDHYCHATVLWYIALSRMKLAGGQVMGQPTPMTQVSRAVGGVPIAPDTLDMGAYRPALIKPDEHKSLAEVLAKQLVRQEKKASGATSGNM